MILNLLVLTFAVDYENTLTERIEGLVNELEESRKRFNEVIGMIDGKISREDCDVFLRFYKLNLILVTLIEVLPGALKSGDFRELYLIANKNIKTLEGGIIYAFSREKPIGLD